MTLDGKQNSHQWQKNTDGKRIIRIDGWNKMQLFLHNLLLLVFPFLKSFYKQTLVYEQYFEGTQLNFYKKAHYFHFLKSSTSQVISEHMSQLNNDTVDCMHSSRVFNLSTWFWSVDDDWQLCLIWTKVQTLILEVTYQHDENYRIGSIHIITIMTSICIMVKKNCQV